ncbi:hypothetical protein J6Z39_06080 [bacterium]|nr:hypothetical protein [bacterium]
MDMEQRMHYQMQLDDALAKRKRALIAVCTLGLSETPLAMLFKESDGTRKKMSFGDSPAGWIFQVAWFLLWTVISMAGFWIINIFKFLNYAEFVHRLKKILAS